jgi:hypothetical protein
MLLKNKSLTYLNLNDNFLRMNEFSKIFESLEENNTLTELNISSIFIFFKNDRKFGS